MPSAAALPVLIRSMGVLLTLVALIEQPLDPPDELGIVQTLSKEGILPCLLGPVFRGQDGKKCTRQCAALWDLP